MISHRKFRRGAPLGAALLLFAALAALGLAACGGSSSSAASPSASPAAAASSSSRPATGAPDFNQLIVATTTSLNDSGLLTDVVQPAFEAQHPTITMKIVAVGSGAAIAMAQAGNADVLLVHSAAAEVAFMDGGYGTLRLPFAYNYFTIVGPKSDPAKVAGATTAAQAFKQIAAYGKTLPAGKVAFVSRGDASGTNTKELNLWSAAGVTPAATATPAPTPLPEPSGSWYIKTGQGMGATLQIANQKQAYSLTDTATYLADKSNLTIVPLLEKSADLKNQYNVILINQSKFPVVNTTGAEYLASWLVGPEGQKAIAAYGKSKYGQALFFPNSDAVNVTLQK
jgi:tungstate transport system substrate-binding protein